MTYLWHVTLTTGNVVPQTREDVDAQALARVARLLRDALEGGEPEVLIGYTMRAKARGPNLTATLHAGEALILTTAVALRSRNAPALWQQMHDTADPALGPLVTARGTPPRVPWIADRIERGMALALLAAGKDGDLTGVPNWTGAWAVLIGWAWMEYDR